MASNIDITNAVEYLDVRGVMQRGEVVYINADRSLILKNNAGLNIHVAKWRSISTTGKIHLQICSFMLY